MSDDVKVKFSGDFTDVSKGAADASKKAGTAMGAWVSEYTNSLKNSLVGAVALGSIVGNFINNFKAAFEKMKEIDSIARKVGVTRVELQQFGKIGKEFNIDMETMGRSIAFANKTLGAAALGNKEAQKSLEGLGYSVKEVTGGNIRSIDVLYRLAEVYEKNKKEHGDVIAQNLLSKQTTQVYGRAGAELTAIIKEGTAALKERIATMKIYSEEEVRSGARAARQVEKGQMAFARFFGGNQSKIVGQQMDLAELRGFESEFKDIHGGAEENESMASYLNRNPKLKKEYSKFMMQKAKGAGWTASDLAAVFSMKSEGSMMENLLPFFRDKESRTFYQAQHENALYQQSKADAAAKAAASNPLSTISPSNIPVLAASSLQQIGGGDIASVAGMYSGNVEDYTRRTAEATEKLVSQDQPASKKITSVAK